MSQIKTYFCDELLVLEKSVSTRTLPSRQQSRSEQQADSYWIGPRTISGSELRVFEMVSYCLHLGKQRAESEQANSFVLKYFPESFLVVCGYNRQFYLLFSQQLAASRRVASNSLASCELVSLYHRVV